jgi:type VI secretion system secreted protein VgrG
VVGNLKEKIQNGNQSLVLDMGNTYLKNTMGNWVLQCPLGTIAMTGMSISINGTTGLSLQVGGSCISITPASISISAPMVLINSGPAVAVPAPPCTPAAPDMPKEPKDPAAPDIADDGTKFDKM